MGGVLKVDIATMGCCYTIVGQHVKKNKP